MGHASTSHLESHLSSRVTRVGDYWRQISLRRLIIIIRVTTIAMRTIVIIIIIISVITIKKMTIVIIIVSVITIAMRTIVVNIVMSNMEIGECLQCVQLHNRHNLVDSMLKCRFVTKGG